MDAARWERIQALFHEALTLPEPRRRAFLETECRDDPALLADVLALLAEDAAGDSLLDRELAHVAHEVLDASVPVLRTIGLYRVRSVLGQGGMGVVYLAEREDLRHQVAIKVLRDASLSPARRARFEREEQTLAQLAHPSIARLYDADTLADGTPYFVMEYVEGLPLTKYCQAHRCSVPERLRLFRAVCEAVLYAHRQAIIHRDLKPSNILVSEEGHVKLLDFGIAKPLEGLEAAADQTQTGLRLMTPAYAAPEQIRGEAVGVYTDVYALGVILYELLAGRLPFDLSQRTPGQIETAILKHEPEKPSARARRTAEGSAHPSAIGKRAWADLDVLCLRAMHKDPQRRYPTVEALMRDLDHFLEGRPLEARPDTLGYRLGKFLRRNRREVAAAAVGAVVVVSLIVFYTLRLAQERDRARSEAEKAGQVSEFLIGLFEAGDPFAAGTDSLDVQTLLQRGTERAEQLEGQPAVQAQMLDVLGRVHLQLSQYDRAEVLLRQALSFRRRPGHDPRDLAENLENLGVLYTQAGAYDSAEVYLREALTLREQHLPPGHPDLAANLNKLGSLLTEQGKYGEAEVLYRLALRMQRDAYDGPSEDLGRTLSNLGVNFFNQGDPAAAGLYYRQALAVDRAVFGPDHPNVAIELGNLAMALEAQQNFAAADSMLTEALRIRRLKLGNEHFYTAFGLVQLGSLKRKTGDYVRAEAYLREALAINEQLLGPDHVNTNVARSQLALTLRDGGNYRDAEPLLRHAARAFRKALGDQHYYSGSSLCQLADVLHHNGDDARAEVHYRECLPILKAVLPAGHAVIVLYEGKFGDLLAAQSRFEEAEPLLAASYESLREQFGPDHEDTHRAARRLVELYEAWGELEKAARFRAELAEMETGLPGG